MKKIVFAVAVVSAFALSSCGGEMSLCDCMGLKDKYDSKEEAEKDLGKEKIDKCMELVKNAKEEDIKKCDK